MDKTPIARRAGGKRSHSQRALVQVHWMQAVFLIFEKKKTGAAMKSNSCKNRNDIAGHSIDLEWHVCLGDTSVHILRKLQEFISETGHEPNSFLAKIIFASMFNEITRWDSLKVQNKCLVRTNDLATYAARFRPGHWWFFGRGS